MKKINLLKKMRRGDNFVSEPTGSATMVNLDGRTEHRSAGELSKLEKKQEEQQPG